MNYVKMTCISIPTPITSNIKLPQFYPEIENRVFSPVVLGDDREKGLVRNLKGNAPCFEAHVAEVHQLAEKPVSPATD